MTPTNVVALANAWGQWQREPSFPFTPDHCINGTRVVIDALRELDVAAKPVSIGVIVFNRFAFDLFEAGVPVGDWPPHAHSVGIDPDQSANGTGWDGHLVAEGDGWMLDISAAQFHRPGRIHQPGPRLFNDVLPPVGQYGRITDSDGQVWVMERRPENNFWRHAPGWRPQPDMVNEVLRRLEREAA